MEVGVTRLSVALSDCEETFRNKMLDERLCFYADRRQRCRALILRRHLVSANRSTRGREFVSRSGQAVNTGRAFRSRNKAKSINDTEKCMLCEEVHGHYS